MNARFAHRLSLAVAAVSLAGTPLASPAFAAEPVKALVHHAVSTKVPAAQEAFDEGLTLIYAFNRYEAKKRFELAAKLDPSLAMAYWGQALAVGPNLNVEMTADDIKAANVALASAKKLESGATPAEQRYIDALATRYQTGPKPDKAHSFALYRDAMAKVHAADPADDDAATLYAESMMDVDSWGYADHKPVGSQTAIVDTLRGVLARNPSHIGANHYFVHAMDFAGYAQAALPSADLLASLPAEPAASHLVHMAGHTYLDTGHLAALKAANEIAVGDDDAYAASIKADPFSLDYYGHNLDFYGGAGILLDDRATIDDVAKRYEKAKSWRGLLLDAREGRWAAIAAWPAPKSAFAGMTWHYVRGLAALAAGSVGAAQTELAIMRRAAGGDSSGLFDTEIGLLDARIAHARSDDALAERDLRDIIESVADYPPETSEPWYFPTGEWLGAIRFERGDFEGAEAAYRADLARVPNNARCLMGLMRTLSREGKLAEMRALAPQIAANWDGPLADLESADI